MLDLTIWVICCNNDQNMIDWSSSLQKSVDFNVKFHVINQGREELSKEMKSFLYNKGCIKVIDNLNHRCLVDTWNFCIRETKTEYLMISNDDVIFKYGWFEEINKEEYKDKLYLAQSYCFIVKKELFDKVGFFDEGFKQIGFEDEDYYLRMLEKKVPMVYGSSGEYPFDGDRILQYLIHKDGTSNDYSSNSQNAIYMRNKYNGKSFPELKQEYEQKYFEKD